MYLHANAKLGLAGRFALVKAVEGGLSLKAAAAAFSVSPATAHRLVASLAGGERGGAAHVVLSVRSAESAKALAAAVGA
jgi:hypothetical protein